MSVRLPVDVVVPVYNAVADARRCVESVLACTTHPFRLIVIDDASPDPAVGDWLGALEALHRDDVVLLRNDTNLGFVGTANRGLAMSQGDVVLLNSDTIVGTRWLEKLVRCAESDPRIGTITPFSNNAEICSFPRFCVDNPWQPDGDLERVNRALEAVAAPVYPDLPTGVGFCMYVRRALLDRCGAFDPVFGRGYGEENDLCMRAAKAGFRNVLCEDTFVAHLGSRSFDADKAALSATNMQVLLDRHPEYLEVVMAFIAEDPLRPLRALAEACLVADEDPRDGVLHIVHGDGGGTELHARSLMAGMSASSRNYLAIVNDSRWAVEDHAGGGLRVLDIVRRESEAWNSFFGRLCTTLSVDVCHVHNVLGAREGLLEALGSSPVPFGYTIHDLNFACPTITFIDSAGRFCGAETNEVECNRCLADQPAFAGVDIREWRGRHALLASRAAFVIAPSRWAAATFRRYFGSRDVEVIPHATPPIEPREALPLRSAVLLPADGLPTVAVIGAIGPDKGARRLERLVELTRKTGARLRWVVVGYVDWTRGPLFTPDAVLTIHGRYDRADLRDLLAHYRTRVVVYPSACPETFSYTLSEAWSAGYPVVVPPIGALGERVVETGAGFVFDDWTDETKMLAQIERLVGPGSATEWEAARTRARAVCGMGVDDMCSRTLATYRAAIVGAGRRESAGKTLTAENLADAGRTTAIERWWKSRPGLALASPSPATIAGGQNVPVASPGASAPVPGAFLRFARRVRSTAVGGLLVKVIPSGLRERLRASLQ